MTAQPPPRTLSLEMARIRSSSLMGSDLDPRRLYTTGQRFVGCPESQVSSQAMSTPAGYQWGPCQRC